MPRAVREQQMLDAAVRVFGQHGYRAASMDEIAKLAGVSKPLVYLYLTSKEELFLACVRREAQALIAAVRDGVDRDQPADRQLWDGMRSFFTYTSQHPDSWAVLHQARTHGELFATEMDVTREEITSFVRGLIEAAHRTRAAREGAAEGRTDGKPGGEADGKADEAAAMAQALVGAAESLAGWSAGRPEFSAKDAAATMMNLAWAGLGNLLDGRPWTAARTPG